MKFLPRGSVVAMRPSLLDTRTAFGSKTSQVGAQAGGVGNQPGLLLGGDETFTPVTRR